MEQHRTPPSNDGPRRGTPPAARLPPQARRRPGDGERRSGPGAGPTGRPRARLPNPRLTGLGGGLFCIVVMILLGFLDQLLFASSLMVYGVLYLPVCVLTAVWVRDGDLLTAPVALPIAFAGGLVPASDGNGGLLGRLMGVFTGLATQAGWLYGGTLAAGVIVLVRRVQWVRRRRRRT